MIDEPPTVRLRLDSGPEAPTIVRGLLGGIAEPLAMDPELLDDLKTAVSEACNNVVQHAYPAQPGRMEVALSVDDDAVAAAVTDHGVGIVAGSSAEEAQLGIGLPVIRALARDVQLRSAPDGGTEISMRFDARRNGRYLYVAPGAVAAPAAAAQALAGAPSPPGEVAVSVSPVMLLGGALGRLVRTLAAGAHFSLDRFSDLYLITDALAAHAAAAAAGERIEARLQTAARRLELLVGPFRSGTGARLQASAGGEPASPLMLLADQLAVEPAAGDEALRVVVIDHRR